MISEKNNDAISRALASHLEPLMPAPGWEQGVLKALAARRRRQRVFTRCLSVISSAAAILVAAMFGPSLFHTARQLSVDYEQYIYTDAYYSALPQSNLSISEEFNAMFASSQIPTSLNLVEPFDPLPPS